MTKKERNLLWIVYETPIHRYLFANTYNRGNGYLKAIKHEELCKIYLAYHFNCDIDNARNKHLEDYDKVHYKTSELTSYLDTVIGFPLKDLCPDYQILAPKFFDVFLKLAKKSLT